MKNARALAVALVGALGCRPAAGPSPTLSFADGPRVVPVALDALLREVPAEIVEGFDPYYGRPKRFRAFPLARALEVALGASPARVAAAELVLTALDGYTVTLRGGQLDGALVAFADLDVPGFEPIGPSRANPGPFYLVWRGPGADDLAARPRPWQLAKVALASFEDVFPHVVPTGVDEGDPAWRGFRLFKDRCLRCHAINREGGRVGPELNVPRSVLEYRDPLLLKQFITNPYAFRYGNMPPQADLGDAELDLLLAYLAAMKDRKHDPDAGKFGGHP